MTRAMQPADLYLLREVTDCELHPDGRRCAYVVSWLDEATDSNRSQIWLHDGTTARPLTYGHADSTPRFSPDGTWLAYLSAPHRGPAQLRALHLQGGEAQTLTTADDGVGEPAWLSDSSGLVFTAPVRPAHEQGCSAQELEQRPTARRIDTTQYRYNGRGWTVDRRRHVFVVRLPSVGVGSVPVATQLTDGPWDDAAPAPSPDGRTVAFVSARHDDREWTGGNDVWLVPLRGGRASRRTNGGTWSHVVWSPDGQQLVVHGNTRRDIVELASWHVAGVGRRGEPVRVGDGEVACGGPLYGRVHAALVGNQLYSLGVRRGAVHVDRYDLASGARRPVITGTRVVKGFGVSGNGRRLVFVASGPDAPGELFEHTGGGERRLTDVTAPFLSTVTLAPVEDFVATGADGYPVHGFVCRPAGRARGRRPARRGGLLYVHGGPLSQYSWAFFDEFQLAAAAGYVVVGANPRGSDGYGAAHADAIRGAWGGLDWADVQTAADHLASQADVDPTRLGIGGGSYGGYMTAWATAHTDRFKAALVERAVTNLVTLEATTDIGWFVGVQTATNSLTDVERMRRHSPITFVANVTTPTLVLHSDQDWRCPPEQAEQWFAALRRLGVATELVRFPGENHELTRAGRPSLRVARFELVAEWFDRYLNVGR